MNRRAEGIRDTIKEHPDWTMERIGEEYGVTRERMRQIIRRFHIPYISPVTRNQPKCKGCKKTLSYGTVSFLCAKCKSASLRSTVKCLECGLNFERKISTQRNKRVFCNRHCFGVFWARNYGFTAHPENRRYTGKS